MIRAEIFKNSSWKKLSFRAGETPVVTNEYSIRDLFRFVAPMVQFRVYADAEQRFIPGGAWEISYQDEVRVFFDTVQIFRGIVAREILWDPKQGRLTFKAMGWLGAINEIYAGRPAEGGKRYRYRKDVDLEVDGEEIEYEYIALPDTYETDWERDLANRFGFEKEWIFDTRARLTGDVFKLESNQTDLYDVGGIGAEFDYRRRKDNGFLYNVGFSDLITELIRQLRVATGKMYTLGAYDPGSIGSEFDQVIALGSDRIDRVNFFTNAPDGMPLLYAVAWTGDPLARKFTRAKLSEITSQFDLTEKIDLEFRLPSGGFGFDSGTPDQIIEEISWQDRNFWTQGTRPGPGENQITIFQFWSWIYFDPHVNGLRVSRRGRIERHVVDLTHFNIVSTDVFTNSQELYNVLNDEIPRVIDELLADFPAIWTSWDVEPNWEDRFRPNPLRGNDIFNYEIFAPVNTIRFGNGTYSRRGKALIYTGPLNIESVALDLKNARIVDVLADICKLTNSRLHIDADKKVYVVNETYFTGDVVNLTGMVIEFKPGIRNHHDDELRSISTRIVNNENYERTALEYYVDEYLPEDEDTYTIKCLADETNAALFPLNAIWFEGIGFGCGESPAIVRRVTPRDGDVMVFATRRR